MVTKKVDQDNDLEEWEEVSMEDEGDIEQDLDNKKEHASTPMSKRQQQLLWILVLGMLLVIHQCRSVHTRHYRGVVLTESKSDNAATKDVVTMTRKKLDLPEPIKLPEPIQMPKPVERLAIPEPVKQTAVPVPDPAPPVRTDQKKGVKKATVKKTKLQLTKEAKARQHTAAVVPDPAPSVRTDRTKGVKKSAGKEVAPKKTKTQLVKEAKARQATKATKDMEATTSDPKILKAPQKAAKVPSARNEPQAP